MNIKLKKKHMKTLSSSKVIMKENTNKVAGGTVNGDVIWLTTCVSVCIKEQK